MYLDASGQQEKAMVSWQARLVSSAFAIRNRIHARTGRLDVPKERAGVELMARMFRPLGRITCDPVSANGVPAEWICPPGRETRGVVLHLHGGSFVSGSIASHRTLAGNVALASGSRVLLVDYGLAPEHPFPAGLADAVTAFTWLLEQGFPAGQVAVAGDSAGGNLALALLLRLRDHRQPAPAAAVCFSPAPDLTFSGASWGFNASKDLLVEEAKEREAVRLYLVDTDPRTPLASPTFADLHGLPPLLIQVGSHEVLRSDCETFAENARAAGVEVRLEVWPGMQHEWQFAARLLPEGRSAIAHAGAFLEAAFSRFRDGSSTVTLVPRPGSLATRRP
jgi:epsilon-lactone hydrolase